MKASNFIKTAMAVMIAEAVLCIAAAGNAQAEQCPLVPGDATSIESFEPSQLLDQGQFPQLDAALEKLHKKDLASDGEDLLTLRVIYDIQSGRKENLMRMWADQRPQSFFAQFSAGAFYANQAYNARGSDAISRTSRGQLSKMSAIDSTAIGYLQKAMQLDPHSALPHARLLGIAAQEGQAAGKTAEQWLQAANQVDPKNLAARIAAVNYLSPRWGGSFDLLDQMVEQAKKSLSAKSAHYLEYNVVLAKASHEEVIAKNKSKAQVLYKRAKEMCANSQAAQDGMVRTY